MKSLNLIAGLALLTLLTACNSGQDPLAGAPDSVRNGIPANEKLPPSAKPISKEALQIDAPNLVNGKVDSEIKFDVGGRVLIPGVNFELSVENMDAFPKATFKNGVFKWTPLKENLNNGADTQFELIIKLATVPGTSGYPVSIETKKIAINIFRTFIKPVIASVTASRTYTVGRSFDIPIVIQDADALTSDDFTLVFKDCSTSYTSVASALDYDKTDFIKDSLTGKLNGKVTLNLVEKLLPYNIKDFCFNVVTYSKFGVASDPYKVDVTIKNPLSPTNVSQDSIEIRQSTVGEYNISFYDPKQIGDLSIKSKSDISVNMPGSTVTCDNTRYTPVIDCKISLNATTAAIGTYKLDFVVTNSMYPQDTVETKHSISIKVKGLL